jgi:fatty-acyl-CoA synthase
LEPGPLSNSRTPRTPVGQFLRAVQTWPDRPALRIGDVTHSFAELDVMSWRLALVLGRMVADEPLRIGFISRNSPLTLVCMLAVMRSGAVWVPFPQPPFVAGALSDYFADTHCQLVIYHSEFCAQVLPLCDHARTVSLCVDAPIGGTCVAEIVSAPDVASVPALLEDDPDKPIAVFHTGGTSGKPKRIIVTVRSLTESLAVIARYLDTTSGAPVCLSVSPLAHIAGTIALATLISGALQIVHDQFDVAAIVSAIARHRVTHLWLPPSGLIAVLEHPDIRSSDLSSLEHLCIGGQHIPPALLERASDIFGPCLSELYGQKETGVISWLTRHQLYAAAHGHHPERLRSCGRPCNGVRLAIARDDGSWAAAGEEGAIVVQSDVVRAYDDRLETQAAVAAWRTTGDIGYLDPDGFLYITGRANDLIVSDGLKLSSIELERVISELPGIADCAVVGIPDSLHGESIKAIVVVQPTHTVADAQIRAHCRKRLGPSMIPRVIERRGQLPKTAAGKTDRSTLRAPASPSV